jgi:fluoride exporter
MEPMVGLPFGGQTVYQSPMFNLLLVAAGGACGASLRHLVNLAVMRIAGPAFPWGTLAVNVVGSLLMGVLAGWLARRQFGAVYEIRLLLATGLLGGFTTFSAFSFDFATLWRDGASVAALLYVAASVILSIVAVFSGFALTRLAQ